MNRLSAFFKSEDNNFGVFYPTDHILAAFPNLSDADHARRELNLAGLLEADVITASGEEVEHFFADRVVETGLWGLFMTSVSRAIGTEAVYADQDQVAAQNGAGFIGVHCATDGARVRAWNALEIMHPVAARFYAAGGIEHLAGEV